MLLRAWSLGTHRPTRDVHLLGRGERTTERLEALFSELWALPVAADGLELEPGSVRSQEIREAQEYGGIRVTMTACLGNARIPIQIDVGFGDAVTPGAQELAYPTLLDHESPVLLAYPPETVVAEKLEAIVTLGSTNTRMKDFYDLWILGRSFPFTEDTLSRAITATFRRRGTPLPASVPAGLSEAFSGNPAKQRQWDAFLGRIGVRNQAPSLAAVAEMLRSFLLPPVETVQRGVPFTMRWPAGGPWEEPS